MMPERAEAAKGTWKRSGGFSLVEVVLSIGIISFAMVALLGIAAVGTNAGLESKWDTEGGQIFEQVMGQLRTKPFTGSQAVNPTDPKVFPLPALSTDEEKIFYLDDRNNVVEEGAASRKVRVASRAAVTLPYMTASGTLQGTPSRDSLALVIVEISPHPPRSQNETSTYFAEVCRLQQ